MEDLTFREATDCGVRLIGNLLLVLLSDISRKLSVLNIARTERLELRRLAGTGLPLREYTDRVQLAGSPDHGKGWLILA